MKYQDKKQSGFNAQKVKFTSGLLNAVDNKKICRQFANLTQI